MNSRKRLAQQRSHDAVRFGKRFAHDRLGGAERLQHVGVLRALAGIQESNLGRGATAAEDPLCAYSFPERSLVRFQRFEGDAAFGCQVSSVGVIDGHALGRAQISLGRSSRCRRVSCRSRLLYAAQTLDQFRLRVCADDQRTA